MTDFRSLSRLPSDPRYWNGLARRISDAGLPIIIAQPRKDPWVRLCIRISGAAAAAAGAIFLVQSLADRPDPIASPGITPTDPQAASFLTADRPPAVSQLLVSDQRRQ